MNYSDYYDESKKIRKRDNFRVPSKGYYDWRSRKIC